MPKIYGVPIILLLSGFLLPSAILASDSYQIFLPAPHFSLSGSIPDNTVQTASFPASSSAPQTSSTPSAQQAPGALPRSSVSYPPPMTNGEKFHYYLRTTYGPQSFFFIAAGSAINQARDSVSAWGQGWDGYGKRFGSAFGQMTIKQSSLFGLKTAFHEDPRYFVSGKSGLWDRSFYAATQVFIAHKDGGGTRPNFTGLASTFAGSYFSRQWHPDSYHTWGDYLSSFGISTGISMAKNVFNEFWPDIKSHLHF
jgi:hypothetical protein